MFCPNCGNQVVNGAKFCGSCGASIEMIAMPTANTAQTYVQQPIAGVNPLQASLQQPVAVQAAKLPLADYLAIHPEYQQKKKEYDKKSTTMTLIVTIAILVLCAVGVYIFVDGILSGDGMSVALPGFGIPVVGMLILLVITSSIGNKAKRDLENYGAELYKWYLAQ